MSPRTPAPLLGPLLPFLLAASCAGGRPAPGEPVETPGDTGGTQDAATAGFDTGAGRPAALPDAPARDDQPAEPTAVSLDAAAAPGVLPAPDAAAAADFVCNLVIGIKATGEWFNAGFESVVENARWEVIPVHNGHLELWADPKNALWSMASGSPCARNPRAPDRVIFVGTNYDYTTTEEFVPRLTAVVENLRTKFPGVRRIELMTYVRGPGNVPCPGNLSVKTYIKAAQDQSNELVAAAFPGLVFVAPKFEVRACSDYSMPPHFTAAAAMAAARSIGAHYLTH